MLTQIVKAEVKARMWSSVQHFVLALQSAKIFPIIDLLHDASVLQDWIRTFPSGFFFVSHIL